MARYSRNYDRLGRGSTDRVFEHSDGSKTIEQYASHRWAPGMHMQDGPRTITKIDPDGNEVSRVVKPK
ncbi:hypothetical protein [Pseudooctadecabacter jejudonensis]|uniref:Uncharacterized protein n=1 Tax=Pseudooctadecabacter jejudonensis TaxID=1391910 RepID=A0A1Y5RYJ1_9RHOB|nr:hypothetical protein [Pseudooctadecabacter jejudonensis]SLN28527.1 hypothetical protein PSJ8397_01207 [Pseudooctadecabacter jejudonensis]